MTRMRLTSAQVDRACGVLLGAACGDALGAGYEFGSAPLPPVGTPPQMIGGGLGGFAPGEWTDDTAQAYAIAEVAATGADLRSEEALTAIARRFADWYAEGPADVGIQTSAVLSRAGRHPTAQEMTGAAKDVHERKGKSGGNGSLMRRRPWRSRTSTTRRPWSRLRGA
jgi:ADP-ribosyl-[dinitrogen reductase] hydrolase